MLFRSSVYFRGRKIQGRLCPIFLGNKEEKRDGLAPSGVFGSILSPRGLQAVLPGVTVPGLRQNQEGPGAGRDRWYQSKVEPRMGSMLMKDDKG